MILDTDARSPELNRRKAYSKLIATIIVVFVTTLVLFGLPGLTSPASAGPGGTETLGWVTRLNVTNAEKAAAWYEDILDMEVNEASTAFPYYAQLFYPEYPDTQIGLSQSTPVQSGKATPTIVVDDIKKARNSLIEKGVKVGDFCNAGDNETVLAFFCDLDSNNLALRQNNVPNKLPQCGSPLCNNCAE